MVSGMKKVRLGYLMGVGRWSLKVRVEKVSVNDILNKDLNDLKRTAWLFMEVLAFQVKETESSKVLRCEAWLGSLAFILSLKQGREMMRCVFKINLLLCTCRLYEPHLFRLLRCSDKSSSLVGEKRSREKKL